MNAVELDRVLEVADRIHNILHEMESCARTMDGLYEATRPDSMGAEVTRVRLSVGSFGSVSAEASMPVVFKLFAGEMWEKLEKLEAELEAMPRLEDDGTGGGA